MSSKISFTLLALLLLILCVWYLWPSAYDVEPKNQTIVAFGDSLVAGVGSESGGGFVSFLEERTDREIINLGVPGDTTADGLARVGDVLRDDPGIVIVLLGGNDALRRMPLEETFANLNAIVTTLTDNGSIVILLGIRGGVLSDPYSDQFESLTDRTHALYVPNILSGLITKPELMSDSVHPNDLGYRLIADRVYDVLNDLLSE